jgi:hypothetical protein
MHAAGGIRTHDPSKRSAADLRHRLRGHWDRQVMPNNIMRWLILRLAARNMAIIWPLENLTRSVIILVSVRTPYQIAYGLDILAHIT